MSKCHNHIYQFFLNVVCKLYANGYSFAQSYLQIIMERLPVLERSASGIRTQQATRLQELVDFIQTQVLLYYY